MGAHCVLDLAGPGWWMDHLSGEGASVGLSYGHVIVHPSPTPPQTDRCPILGHSPIALVLAVPQSTPHPSPHTYSFTVTLQPCLAVAVSPGYATLLVSGQELRGLFRVTWSECQGENGAEAKIPGRYHPIV